jgi:hypothetical protein
MAKINIHGIKLLGIVDIVSIDAFINLGLLYTVNVLLTGNNDFNFSQQNNKPDRKHLSQNLREMQSGIGGCLFPSLFQKHNENITVPFSNICFKSCQLSPESLINLLSTEFIIVTVLKSQMFTLQTHLNHLSSLLLKTLTFASLEDD